MIITGAVYISQLLNVTHTLQELNMRSNDIGDDGMAVISEALQHNKLLTTLRVVKCGLSVKGTVVCKMYAKRKHLGCKKCKANQKQHANRWHFPHVCSTHHTDFSLSKHWNVFEKDYNIGLQDNLDPLQLICISFQMHNLY